MLSLLSRVQLFVTLWTVAPQAPLSMGFSRRESCSGLPFPSEGSFPIQGWNLILLCLLHLAGTFFTTSTTWKARMTGITILKEAGEELSQLSTECLCLPRFLP